MYKLFNAARAGCFQCVRDMIEKYEVPHASQSMNEKYTALDFAKHFGNADVIAYLENCAAR